MLRNTLPILAIVALLVAGCGNNITINHSPNGDVESSVGPLQIIFNNVRHTVRYNNFADANCGMEMMYYPNNTTPLRVDYFIARNSSVGEKTLIGYETINEVQVTVGCYTGAVTAGVAATWAWSGTTNLDQLVRDHRGWFNDSLWIEIFSIRE